MRKSWQPDSSRENAPGFLAVDECFPKIFRTNRKRSSLKQYQGSAFYQSSSFAVRTSEIRRLSQISNHDEKDA